jgi:hypothetical protein
MSAQLTLTCPRQQAKRSGSYRPRIASLRRPVLTLKLRMPFILKSTVLARLLTRTARGLLDNGSVEVLTQLRSNRQRTIGGR